MTDMLHLDCYYYGIIIDIIHSDSKQYDLILEGDEETAPPDHAATSRKRGRDQNEDSRKSKVIGVCVFLEELFLLVKSY